MGRLVTNMVVAYAIIIGVTRAARRTPRRGVIRCKTPGARMYLSTGDWTLDNLDIDGFTIIRIPPVVPGVFDRFGGFR